MIYITGDVHGAIVDRFSYYGEYNKPGNKVIVLGDFGVVFFNEKADQLRKQIEEPLIDYLNGFYCDFLFIDGNHDNIDRLRDLSEYYKFGNKVGEVSSNVFYLKRGNVYTIENKTFACMGGATSIDRGNRTEGVNWWSGENPDRLEWSRLQTELFRVDNKVDYILTHTPPMPIAKRILKWEMMCDYHLPEYKIDDGMINTVNCPTAKTLDIVSSRIDFNMWFFGHMHHTLTLKEYPKYVGIYKEVLRLEDSFDAYHKLLPQI